MRLRRALNAVVLVVCIVLTTAGVASGQTPEPTPSESPSKEESPSDEASPTQDSSPSETPPADPSPTDDSSPAEAEPEEGSTSDPESSGDASGDEAQGNEEENPGSYDNPENFQESDAGATDAGAAQGGTNFQSADSGASAPMVACTGVDGFDVTTGPAEAVIGETVSFHVRPYNCDGSTIEDARFLVTVAGVHEFTEEYRGEFDFYYTGSLIGPDKVIFESTECTVGLNCWGGVSPYPQTRDVTWKGFADLAAGESDVTLAEINADSFLEQVEGILGSRLGGSWLETTPDQRVIVNIGVVDLQEADRAAVEAIAPPRVLPSLTPVKYSLEQLLESFVPRIDDIAVTAAGVDLTVWGPEPEINKIEVHLAQPNAELTARLTDAVPADALKIVVDDMRLETIDSRTTYPPYKAGRAIETPSSFCTAGYSMEFEASGTTHYYGSTAGHCANNFDLVEIEDTGKDVGETFSNQWTGRSTVYADATLIRLYDESASRDDIYVNSSLTRDVYSVYPNSSMKTKGVHLCWSGKSSGVGCGDIFQIYGWSANSDGKLLKNLVVLEVDDEDDRVLRGDSGGPVYRLREETSSRGAGMMVGRSRVNSSAPNGTLVFLHTVTDIGSRTNTQLRT